MAKTRAERKFAELLLESLDEAFLTLGQTVRFSIYLILETKFALQKQNIPDRSEDFTNAIRKIFGNAAAPLEILIIKCLNKRINCNCKWVGPKWLVPDLALEKYLKLAQLSLENSEKKYQVADFEVMLNEGDTPEQET